MFWYILIMLFWYWKCINTLGIFLLLRIFLNVVTEGHIILHVFDEDIVASEIFSFRLVLCSVWLCFGVHRLHILVSFFAITLFCSYPLFLFFFFFFTSVCTPFCIACTFIFSIYRYSLLLPKYFVRQESVCCRPES